MGKKTLTITYEYPPLGGGAKVARALAEKLKSSDIEIDLITMWFRGLKRVERFSHMTVYRALCWRINPSICYALEMSPYLLSSFILALKLIKKNKYSLNHSHFIFPDGFLCLLIKKLTDLPYTITAHGSDVPGYNPNRFKLMHVVLRPI